MGIGVTGTRPSSLALRLASDNRLAKLAASGDERAFAVIYDRYSPEIYRYCGSVLRNPHDTADAFQSTMAAAFEAIQGERRELALRPWLYRIAHNESVSMVRARRPVAALAADAAAGGPPLERHASTRDRLRSLLVDLRRLPARQGGAIVMRELAGLDYTEIGGALGVSEGAARQAVYEARGALLEMAAGRELGCGSARATISAGDARRLRGRKLRAHLRDCSDCRAYRASIALRKEDLHLLAPALPLATASTVLVAVVGGVTASGGGGGVLGAIAAGAGKSLGALSAKETIAVAAATVVAGAGAVEVAREGLLEPGPRSDATAEKADAKPVQADGDEHVAKAADAMEPARAHERGKGDDNGESGGATKPEPQRESVPAEEDASAEEQTGDRAEPSPEREAPSSPESPTHEVAPVEESSPSQPTAAQQPDLVQQTIAGAQAYTQQAITQAQALTQQALTQAQQLTQATLEQALRPRR